MPRVSDLLVGLGTGALSEVNEQRKRRQEIQDKIALAESEAKIKQRYPSSSDLYALALMRSLGLTGTDSGGPSSPQGPTLPPTKVLPPDLEAELNVPGTIAAPGPGGSVVLGEGESLTPLSRGDLLRRFGTVAPATTGIPQTEPSGTGLRPESLYVKGMRFSDPDIIEENARRRAQGTTEGMEGRETTRQLAKKRIELQQHLRDIDTSVAGLQSLFQAAEQQVPSIRGVGTTPGLLPLVGMTRKAGMALGTSERAKGFITTFPIEARKQLQTLEKGGRYTNQDVEQIIAASTPQFDESATARRSKVQELLRKFQQERTTVQQQLQGLGASDVSDESQSDPVVRTGTDQATGRRVGQTQSGRIIPLQ